MKETASYVLSRFHDADKVAVALQASLQHFAHF